MLRAMLSVALAAVTTVGLAAGSLQLQLPDIGDPSQEYLGPGQEALVGRALMRTLRDQGLLLEDPFLQLVVETARDVYGQPQRLEPMSGGTGPNHPFIHELGLPVATAGLDYPESNAHAPNENMRIDLFLKAAMHTARIMRAFSEGE